MLRLQARTQNKTSIIECPESFSETATFKFQKLISEWDGEDWCQLFSILSGMDVDQVRESKDGKLEAMFYQCISFVFTEKIDFEKLPLPETLSINSKIIPIPRDLGRLSIGQAIQARKSIEGVKDTRECLSIITAIYLQPLLDNAKYDHLRAIEVEQEILLMPITSIFPIGFFFLRQLRPSGNMLQIALDRVTREIKETLRKLLKLIN